MKPIPAWLTRGACAQDVFIPEPLLDIWKECILHFIKLPKTAKVPLRPLNDERFFSMLIHAQRETITRLWEAFNTERGTLSRYLMDPKREAMGYLLAFHLANQARLIGCLQRVHQRGPLVERLLKHSGTLRFFDIGAGTGALSQLFAHLNAVAGQANMQVDLFEARGAFADIAQQGLRLVDPKITIVNHKMRLEKGHALLARLFAEASDDLIGVGLGYLWNEISTIAPAARTLKAILNEQARSTRKAFLVLMEPSNQRIARSAMALRDELVGMGYRIVYPCPSASSLCPMNDLSRDWCYSEFGFERPQLLQKVDKILDIQRGRIGSASFVMATPALAAEWQLESFDKNVIVGRPIARKHPRYPTFSYLLCTPSGLTKTKPVPKGLTGFRGDLPENAPPHVEKSDDTPYTKGAPRTKRTPRAKGAKTARK